MPPDNETQRHYATLITRVSALEREVRALAGLLDRRYDYDEGRFRGLDQRLDGAYIRIGRLELAADAAHPQTPDDATPAELTLRLDDLTRQIAAVADDFATHKNYDPHPEL